MQNPKDNTNRNLAIVWLVAVIVLILIGAALARDNGQWSDLDDSIRSWYRHLMQPDYPSVSCCGEADAYYADSFAIEGDHYVAIITDEREIPYRPPIAPGTRIPIPNQKMKYDAGNPTGHGIVFIGSSGQVYCYVTPGGI